MKKDVYILTNINHYDDDELYVWSNAYSSLAKAKEDMIADFNSRLSCAFADDEQSIVEASDVWMELRDLGGHCTWGIECQSVEFDEQEAADYEG